MRSAYCRYTAIFANGIVEVGTFNVLRDLDGNPYLSPPDVSSSDDANHIAWAVATGGGPTILVQGTVSSGDVSEGNGEIVIDYHVIQFAF
jgi:hypothetical protein